jgi:hypothetical protein
MTPLLVALLLSAPCPQPECEADLATCLDLARETERLRKEAVAREHTLESDLAREQAERREDDARCRTEVAALVAEVDALTGKDAPVPVAEDSLVPSLVTLGVTLVACGVALAVAHEACGALGCDKPLAMGVACPVAGLVAGGGTALLWRF